MSKAPLAFFLFLLSTLGYTQETRRTPSTIVDMAQVPAHEKELALKAVDLAQNGESTQLSQLIHGHSGASNNTRALLELLACSANKRRTDTSWANGCLSKVVNMYQGTPSADIAKHALDNLTGHASPREKRLTELQSLAQTISREQFPSLLAQKVKDFIRDFGKDPESLKGLMEVAEAVESSSDSSLTLTIYEMVWQVNVSAKHSPEFAAEYADALNMQGRSADALSVVDSISSEATTDAQRARLALTRALALRDLHRMSEAQQSLDQAHDLAIVTNNAVVLGIIKDLRSPNHSMDQSVHHHENQPVRTLADKGPVWIGIAAVAAGIMLWVATKFMRTA